MLAILAALLSLAWSAHAAREGEGSEAETRAIAQAEEAAKDTHAIQEKLKEKDLAAEKRAAFEQTLKSKDENITAGEKRFPESPKYATTAGTYWYSRGDLDKAVTSADRALELATPDGDPKLTSKALTIKGLAVFRKRDYEASLRLAEEALKLDPGNSAALEVKEYSKSALHLRGLGEVVAKRTERIFALTDPGVAHTAEEWSDRQASNPTEAGRLVGKVIKSREEGDLGAQLQYAEAAVRADPSDPMTYFQRGRVRKEVDDQNGAIIDFTQAMHLGWKDALMFKLRAEALIRAGSYREAYVDALMAVAYNPKLAEAYVLRAMARRRAEGNDAAGIVRAKAEIMADVEKAVRLDPALRVFLDDERAAIAEAEEKVRKQAAPAAPKPTHSATDPNAPSGAAIPAGPSRDARGGLVLYAGAVLGLIALLLAVAVVALLASRKGTKVVETPLASGDHSAGDSGRPDPVAAPAGPRTTEGSLLGGHIRVVREIGKGGMGVVCLGEDMKLRRPVAVKQLAPGLSHGPAERERFRAEALTMAKLKHPNSASIYELIEEPDGLFLVMEYIDGETLAQRLTRTRKLAPAECLPILKQLCQGIGHAHNHGVLHRDLKPSNVMIERETELVKIMDLGIARFTESPDGRTVTATQIGTPAYMAPEQHDGVVSRESDLYSMAIMLYELLCGVRPFIGDMVQAKIAENYPPITKTLPGWAGLDGFFKRALASNRESRFHSAGEFYEAFENALARGASK
ncbi:MAG: protein kinase [Elusimicrobia bacterium]|nr:protein kinase [Elusimicrobiota bacterium]